MPDMKSDKNIEPNSLLRNFRIHTDRRSFCKGLLGVGATLRRIKIRTEGTVVSVYAVDQKEITLAKEEERDLGKDVNVSIPTQREIESFWF